MRFLIILLILVKILNGESLSDVSFFISKEEGQKLLSTEDEYTDHWSRFDIDSRKGKVGSTKEELIAFQASQVLSWQSDEIKRLKIILTEIDQNIHEQNLTLPQLNMIEFIKTTGVEEGGATAYTRQSYIVLTQSIVNAPKSQLKETVIHEIFHLLTRSNHNFRNKMYEIIGFYPTEQILYPEQIRNWKISNPDAPQESDYYITLTKDGVTSDYKMVMLSNSPYMGGTFFNYISVWFLKIDKSYKMKMFDIGNNLYSFQDIVKSTDLLKKIGRNTNYVIHPEEILADNFVYLVIETKNLSDQWIVDEMRKTIANKKLNL